MLIVSFAVLFDFILCTIRDLRSDVCYDKLICFLFGFELILLVFDDCWY